ncbi:MAG TPA: serine/threonine-protein kinase [Kofleriaceae bacterium]|nr:serine/threonine-protein kinase [Kofleriaceae bacterium]
MVATTAAREQVGPYRVIEAIGAGGSARIDLARIDRAYHFSRQVVLKRPLEHLRGDAKAAQSLRREARLGGKLRHPNIVAVLDAGIHDGYDYLVLEYVQGASLRTAMQAEAPGRVADVPVASALAIVIAAARGLHHAHELVDDDGSLLGLVHRDVSPGNVLLGADGTVKLADFGIAKETRVTTLSGSMHGTVTYMAPEQCRGHAFDRRADVFSLGVILYELVTGTRLFWADNDVASLHRVLSGHVPRPRKLRPALPAMLEDIVMAALASDPQRRTPTALGLAEALEGFAAQTGELATARAITRWLTGSAPPRVSAARPAASDGSLVELIAQSPDDADEAARDPSFGPTDFVDGHDAPTARDARPRRRGVVIASAFGLALAAGGVATFAMLGDRDDVAAFVPPAPPTIAPAPAPAPVPMPVIETREPEPEPEIVIDEPPPRHKKQRVEKPAKTAVKRTAPPVVTPPPPVVDPPRGTPKQWDPGLLLPSDSKRGSKR